MATTPTPTPPTPVPAQPPSSRAASKRKSQPTATPLNPARGPGGEKCRRRPTKALKRQVLKAQGHRCFACTAVLQDVEYDHVIALGLGGSNASDNWAALCPYCHRSKTRQDLRLIAKAKRRRRFQETGRSRAPGSGRGWSGPFGQSKGFDKTLRKRMDGLVEQRCECGECRPFGRATAKGRPD